MANDPLKDAVLEIHGFIHNKSCELFNWIGALLKEPETQGESVFEGIKRVLYDVYYQTILPQKSPEKNTVQELTEAAENARKVLIGLQSGIFGDSATAQAINRLDNALDAVKKGE